MPALAGSCHTLAVGCFVQRTWGPVALGRLEHFDSIARSRFEASGPLFCVVSCGGAARLTSKIGAYNPLGSVSSCQEWLTTQVPESIERRPAEVSHPDYPLVGGMLVQQHLRDPHRWQGDHMFIDVCSPVPPFYHQQAEDSCYRWRTLLAEALRQKKTRSILRRCDSIWHAPAYPIGTGVFIL